MRKGYINILIGIVVLLWVNYLFESIYLSSNCNGNCEGFTPRINGFCRPYIRNMRQTYESFISNYGPQVVVNKLKKWNIY